MIYYPNTGSPWTMTDQALLAKLQVNFIMTIIDKLTNKLWYYTLLVDLLMKKEIHDLFHGNLSYVKYFI